MLTNDAEFSNLDEFVDPEDVFAGVWYISFSAGDDGEEYETEFTLWDGEGFDELERLWMDFADENSIPYDCITDVDCDSALD